ncbi:MAG TPA: large-conductance mechanosensitive channel protein MscL [Thermoanaerobaculia bacterium]|nr:large-conductance mechanosensitive channel protein MscL [Thermoanaerobaculia bacterium]
MLKEFKEFAVRGNLVDMAIGIILGGAFGTIAKSLVDDVIMPPIGLMLGGVDFVDLFLLIQPGDPVGPYASLAAAQEAGAVTINYGQFFNNVVSFLIVAVATFFLVKGMNRLRRGDDDPKKKAEPVAKECPYCTSSIPVKAIRCPMCTSELVGA